MFSWAKIHFFYILAFVASALKSCIQKRKKIFYVIKFFLGLAVLLTMYSKGFCIQLLPLCDLKKVFVPACAASFTQDWLAAGTINAAPRHHTAFVIKMAFACLNWVVSLSTCASCFLFAKAVRELFKEKAAIRTGWKGNTLCFEILPYLDCDPKVIHPKNSYHWPILWHTQLCVQ